MGKYSTNKHLLAWWPLQRRRRDHLKAPEAALFQGLHMRLTLWYCEVLGAALVLFSVALYFGVRYFLLQPVVDDAARHAQGNVGQWLAFPLNQTCPSPDFTDHHSADQSNAPSSSLQFMNQVTVCFDQNGTVLQGQYLSALPPAFLSSSIVKTALQTGQPQSDIVNAGGDIGKIYRYAQVVPNPAGNGYIGVVLIGESVQTQESALSLLLILLFCVGGIALAGAGVGGLFLANRALAPARLAWTNQQRFIADASHELRTPLTLLRADAEVLLRSHNKLEEEDAVLLEDIVTETQHMATLANNMLTLARLDQGSSHYEYEVINITDLVGAGVKRVRTLANEVNVTIDVEQSTPQYVVGDRTLLEQAVLILLDNAVKYNHRGGHVMVSTVAHDNVVALKIQDTGIGISSEHLSRLGERFYRVDKARTHQAGGTGLGLSIARGTAAIHNGKLTLTSSTGEGTTATLTLPALQNVHNELEAATPVLI